MKKVVSACGVRGELGSGVSEEQKRRRGGGGVEGELDSTQNVLENSMEPWTIARDTSLLRISYPLR